jgi:1-acyl-sn-glycerol-3-phosphate acyltransferase
VEQIPDSVRSGEARSPRSGVGTRPSWWYAFFRVLAWSVIPALFRVRVFGRGNVPLAGGTILASNHQSYMDPVFVAVGLRRPVHFMARDTLFGPPLFGSLIRSLNAFPVRRGGGDVGAMRAAVNRLSLGAALVVFPEGTRTDDGSIGELKEGFCAVAIRSNAAVVPVVIEGAFDAWPKGQAVFAPRSVWVAFGRPLAAPGVTGKERVLFTQEVRRQMEDLQGFLRRVRAGKVACATAVRE